MLRSLVTCFTMLAVCTGGALLQAANTTIDFEDLTLPDPNTGNPYYNGNPGGLTPPAVVNGSFTSHGAGFNNEYQLQDFGFGATEFWNGFSVSRTTDATTAGFGNQYSAIPGSGYGGSQNYGIGFDSSPFFTPTITLPTGQYPLSVRVTNTAYTYFAVRDGNDGGANFVRQFGDDPNLPGSGNQGYPDLLTLNITGLDDQNVVTGTLSVALADYTFPDNADDYTVNTWLPVDLTALGTNTRMLQFSMTTTDNSQFGNFSFPNTPLYFALDNLITAAPDVEITETPEPSAFLSAGVAALMLLAGRKFVRRPKAQP